MSPRNPAYGRNSTSNVSVAVARMVYATARRGSAINANGTIQMKFCGAQPGVVT
ncbi:MAG: hypothetical protein AABO58_18320 [Acidobacteriota bacterium]